MQLGPIGHRTFFVFVFHTFPSMDDGGDLKAVMLDLLEILYNNNYTKPRSIDVEKLASNLFPTVESNLVYEAADNLVSCDKYPVGSRDKNNQVLYTTDDEEAALIVEEERKELYW